MQCRRWLAVLALGLCALASAAWAGTDHAASAVCLECHDSDDMPDMRRSAHAATGDPRTPGCVTCHGASPTHVKIPQGLKDRPHTERMFSKVGGLTPSERNAVCRGCHTQDTQRALWGGSQHDAADVACTACHQVHTNHDKVQAKATQTEVCVACHKEQRTQINRPSHHPLVEGKMSCSDCHNVHGSSGPKLAKKDSTNATCTSCHAEKRGPFVHNHEPVQEDCATCHNPHGSTVQAMLKSRPPMLCQQCHTPHVGGAVGAVGVAAGTNGKNAVTAWQGRSCMNCHTQVHGSNNPSATRPTPHFLLR